MKVTIGASPQLVAALELAFAMQLQWGLLMDGRFLSIEPERLGDPNPTTAGEG